MNNRKNLAGESGSFSPFTLVVTVVAICAMGAAVLLAPAAATPETSTMSAMSYTGPSGYFPNEFVNQAKEIEPQPATF